MSTGNTSRRRVLQSGAAIGALALAGCMGDDDGNTVRMGTSAGGTMDVGLGFEQAVSDHGEDVEYSTVESPGYVGTTYRMNEGQVDGGIVDTNTMSKAMGSDDMFADDPVDTIPWQGFLAFPYSIYVVAREDTDIETFDDLAGANVYPAEPGYSTRATTLDVWSMPQVEDVYEEMEIVDMDVDDAPGAMEEGNIDAAIAYGTPGVGNTGFVVEYDARTDVRYVEHTDALVEAIEEYPGAGLSRYDDVEDDFNWDQDIGADEVASWDLEVTFTFHHDTPAEQVYELTRIAHEHGDTARDAEPRFVPEDLDAMTSAAIDDYPWHPGAAEYYQDNDAWNDDWVIGDPDEAGNYN
ncbi:TAXI family TRAP transporter solute-binding subunit [Natrialba hulunbeirensis]|nr:TAXI family TRAP transporter solute-binding subunit [Natrialba hulunbeirensis]